MERIITSIKGPVKIAYNKFVSNLAKQEDTTSSALCQFTIFNCNTNIRGFSGIDR